MDIEVDDPRPERGRGSRDQGRGPRDPRPVRLRLSARRRPGCTVSCASRRSTPTRAGTPVSPRCSCIRWWMREINIEIRDEDIRMDVFRASGAGGQHVNKTSSAVRLTHDAVRHRRGVPAGAVAVQEQGDRDEDAQEPAVPAGGRKAGGRRRRRSMRRRRTSRFGSQIRSYVFQPYTMVNDHRTELKIPDVQTRDGRRHRSVHRGVPEEVRVPARTEAA